MSLFTMKHFIKNLTTGMSCLLTMETILLISFALQVLRSERDKLCPSSP